MGITFPALKYEVEGNRLTLRLPMENVYSVKALNPDGFLKVTLDKPGKPRTTGKDSQNNKIHALVIAIAQETGNDIEAVKYAAKKMAIVRGYPYETIMGEIVPFSTARISTIEAGYLIETLLQIAAEFNVVIKDYA